MKIICYAYKTDQNELESPFLEYLEQYALQAKDSEKKKEQKVKRIMNIKAHLEHLLNHRGNYNLPPLVEQYRERNVGILKIKGPDNLLRIAFFTVVDDVIVILNAIDKPKLHEKQKKQKVDAMIETFLDQADDYRKQFLQNKYSIPLNL